MTELETPWDSTQETPDNYKPKVCPPDQAEEWTNTRAPGNSSGAKWEWDLLVDLAYASGNTPNTIKSNVEALIEGLTDQEKRKLKEEVQDQ